MAASATGVRLGRVGGVEIFADWSLLVVFALIAYSLAAGVFPSWHPDRETPVALATALGAALLFVASVLVHELAHALVGRLGGVRVRRITLFMLGGIAHLEAEPRTWRAELVMAAAGPATSFVLSLVFLWLAALVAGPIDTEHPDAALAALSPLATLLLWLGPVNLLLAAFNLLPGFPLDGGRVLRAALWGATGSPRKATRWASWGGRALGGLPVGLWLMFIGWFLHSAALAGYRELVVKETLEAVPVARIMQTRLTRVDPDLTVQRLAEEHMMASGQRVLPVERAGRFLGLVSLSDLQKSEPRAWSHMSAAEIMTPVERLACVAPGADAGEALAELARRGVNQLPVLEEGRLVGLLRREDVLKWLALHRVGAEP
jgi:Zn-dependent protease